MFVAATCMAAALALVIILLLRRQSLFIEHYASVTWPTPTDGAETTQWLRGIAGTWYRDVISHYPKDVLLKMANAKITNLITALRLQITELSPGDDLPHIAVVSASASGQSVCFDLLVEYSGNLSIAAKGEVVFRNACLALPVEVGVSGFSCTSLLRVTSTINEPEPGAAHCPTTTNTIRVSLLEVPTFRFQVSSRVGATFTIVNSSFVAYLVRRALVKQARSFLYPSTCVTMHLPMVRPGFLHAVPPMWGESESYSDSRTTMNSFQPTGTRNIEAYSDPSLSGSNRVGSNVVLEGIHRPARPHVPTNIMHQTSRHLRVKKAVVRPPADQSPAHHPTLSPAPPSPMQASLSVSRSENQK